MSRNTIVNGNNVPQLLRPRTKIKYRKRTQTTGNLGEIIPFYVNELVQAGDTFKIDLSSFSRLTVSNYPSMDNLFLDIYLFKQNKNNLVNEFAPFMGENLTGAFEQQYEYEIPKLKLYGSHTSARSLINRLYGLKFFKNEITQDKGIFVSALPLITYWQMWNDWFRDQNYMPLQVIPSMGMYSGTNHTPIYINKATLNSIYPTNLSTIALDPYYTGSATDTDLIYNWYTLGKACRFHDYFSTIIPEPQKGDPTRIPLTGEVELEVYGTGKGLMFTDGAGNFGTTVNGQIENSPTLKVNTVTQGNVEVGKNLGNGSTIGTLYNVIGVPTKEQIGDNESNDSGLMATLNFADAVIGTMNDMRTLVAEQHFLENNGIFGSREKEILRARYGVISSAVTTHTVEYLGGKRIPLNMDTVLQTSSTSSESPQGNAAGYSVTFDADELFVKSFDYPAVILGVAVVRQNHSYSQGLSCQHTKFKPLDFWTPEFNNVGCQPIYMSELFLDVENQENNKKVWGYKMPWQEYREEPDQVTGMLAPDYENSLDVWNYADDYATAPVAGISWLLETPQYLDRTLTVTSKNTDQFMFDFQLNITKVTEVPYFSIPGLDKF